jgi:hypothetical protein
MRVVGDEETLDRPAQCFLCETSPVREEHHVVDTERRFNPVQATPLNGRKYVCERCVDELARLLGYIKSEEAELATARVDEVAQKVKEFEAFLKDEVAQITANLPNVEALTSDKVKPVPVGAKKGSKNG